MSESRRGAWKRPDLVVLTRSTPEEIVLANCKQGKTLGPATQCNNKQVGCNIKATS